MSFLSVVFFFFASLASETSCKLQKNHLVHLVGDIHGSAQSAELQSILIPSAMKKQIVLGIEMDEKTLQTTLLPQFKDSLIALENPISKGFGLTLWAWRMVTWTLIKNEVKFANNLQEIDVSNSISSFTFFLGYNENMQQAVQKARTAKLNIAASTNADLATILQRVDAILQKPLELSGTEILLPVTSLESLRTLHLFFKEVLRAYTEDMMANKEQAEELKLPEMIKYLLPLIDFKKFDKKDKDYSFQIYSYDRQYRSLEARLLFDWRSLHMAKKAYETLCYQEREGISGLPLLILVGAGHLAYIEELLEKMGGQNVRITLSVPPSSHSDFEKLYKKLSEP